MLNETPKRDQAPIDVQKKARTGLLPTMSLRDYKAPRLDVSGQRVATPEELAKKFVQPVFGREARRDPMLPSTSALPKFG